MLKQLLDSISCPLCQRSVWFEGNDDGKRFTNGHFRCEKGHFFQVKDEIAMMKDARLSAGEFEWTVNVRDEKTYTEIRKQYDEYLGEEGRAATRKTLIQLTELAKEQSEPGSRILDVATGMGTLVMSLARATLREVLIIGTDIDEKPLRGAMKTTRREALYDKISFVVTDVKHLAFKPAQVSTVTSYFGFDNIPDSQLAFAEVSRALRPGGAVIFGSLWLNEDSESMKVAKQHKLGQIASRERVRKMLENTGLVLEDVDQVHKGVWPNNPMDALPIQGDEYSYAIIQARKPQ